MFTTSPLFVPVMAVMKQKNLRQAEKTLREMLDRADTGGEGKVDLAEFIKILESNNVQVIIVHSQSQYIFPQNQYFFKR